MHRTSRLQACCWLLALGCGHTQPTQRAQPTTAQTPAPSQPAPNAPLPPPVAEPSSPILPPEQLAELMRTHFHVALWARDAIAEGDLESLRAPLSEIAQRDYASLVPAAWLPQILQLQAAANSAARAPTLQRAARSVASMARICGECHAERAHPLQRDPSALREPNTLSGSLSRLMFRHFWASQRLWEGLVAPSDEAWAAGAAALTHLPSQPPQSEGGLQPGFGQALQRLRDIGVEASSAKTPSQRSELYARTLSTCAECHVRNGVFERDSRAAPSAGSSIAARP